jgi:hypothetical protein
MLPIRFDRDGFEVRARGRWFALPFIATAMIITAVCAGLVWVFIHGPVWASMVAIIIIVLPAASITVALIWAGSHAYALWFIGRWYRLPIGFGLAATLMVLEAAGVRWPDGEPLNGYLWGLLITVVCALAWFFAHSQRMSKAKE